MAKEPNRIMGINPGTRYLGLAIIDGSGLLDWRIKSFEGKWTKGKVDRILDTIRKQIDYFDINAIILKKLHPSRSSKNLKIVVLKIMSLARNRRIKIQSHSIKELEKTYIEGVKLNKRNLAERIVGEYPVLVHEFNKEKSHKNSYYLRMIEAVALAAACSWE
jgi:hypothetical protein